MGLAGRWRWWCECGPRSLCLCGHGGRGDRELAWGFKWWLEKRILTFQLNNTASVFEFFISFAFRLAFILIATRIACWRCPRCWTGHRARANATRRLLATDSGRQKYFHTRRSLSFMQALQTHLMIPCNKHWTPFLVVYLLIYFYIKFRFIYMYIYIWIYIKYISINVYKYKYLLFSSRLSLSRSQFSHVSFIGNPLA